MLDTLASSMRFYLLTTTTATACQKLRGTLSDMSLTLAAHRSCGGRIL